MSKDKFQISLRENGEHSFKRSLESYREYEKTKDQLLLKDTIMFLHQSIELLMKEMLVSHDPYLIFDELKDIPKKQREANAKGVGIFFIDNPPKSVTYEVAINRVDAFINPPELDDSLKQNLERLNRQRNQLEHYAVDADKEEVVRMLEAIHKPILNLFEKHLGPLSQLQTPQIKQTWKDINNTAEEYRSIYHEIYLLMQKFNGQNVPGNLFGVDGVVKLPRFGLIFEEYRMAVDRENDHKRVNMFDILARTEYFSSIEGVGASWVVEIKLRAPSVTAVFQVREYGVLSKSVPWLVAFDEIPVATRSTAKDLKVMVTGRSELEELKKLVE